MAVFIVNLILCGLFQGLNSWHLRYLNSAMAFFKLLLSQNFITTAAGYPQKLLFHSSHLCAYKTIRFNVTLYFNVGWVRLRARNLLYLRSLPISLLYGFISSHKGPYQRHSPNQQSNKAALSSSESKRTRPLFYLYVCILYNNGIGS